MAYSERDLENFGMELRRMTKTTAFQASVNLLRQDYTNRIVSSSPHQTEVRESAYRQILALDELLGVMNTLQFYAENPNNPEEE